MATEKSNLLLEELENSIAKLNDESWFKEVEADLDKLIDDTEERDGSNKKSAQQHADL